MSRPVPSERCRVMRTGQGRVEQAWTGRVVGKAAVPFMINRTAARLHDLDLRKAVLVARLFGSVGPDHDLDGDEGKKCITD